MRIKRKKVSFWGKDEDVSGVKFYARRKQKRKKSARRKISFLAKKQLKRRAVPETEPPKISYVARVPKKNEIGERVAKWIYGTFLKDAHREDLGKGNLRRLHEEIMKAKKE